MCIGIGEHCYIWMDKTMKSDYDAAGKTSLIAKDMAEVYDGQSYRILNELQMAPSHTKTTPESFPSFWSL